MTLHDLQELTHIAQRHTLSCQRRQIGGNHRETERNIIVRMTRGDGFRHRIRKVSLRNNECAVTSVYWQCVLEATKKVGS